MPTPMSRTAPGYWWQRTVGICTPILNQGHAAMMQSPTFPWRPLLPTLGTILLAGACGFAAEEAPVWERWLAATKDPQAALPIPDYSYAGYGLGAKPLPAAGGKVFNVRDFGAIPNDDKEDREQIQAAIRAAEQAGGGVVFFPPGRFLVNEVPGRSASITINGAQVVLKGSGSGPGGTELFMKEPLQPTDPAKPWSTPALFSFSVKKRDNGPSTPVDRDAGKESRGVPVASTAGFNAGDFITLESRTPAANERVLEQLQPWSNWKEINSKGVRFREIHHVTTVHGDGLRCAEPLGIDLVANEEWKASRIALTPGWLVEDLWFHGNFQEEFVHHKNAMHDSGWTFANINGADQAVVRRMRFTDVSAGVNVSGSYACSMLLMRFDGRRGHMTVESQGSYGTLIGLIDDATATGMWHGPGPSNGSVNTVVWRYHGQERSGFDMHASWPYRTLFDASRCGLVGNGGNVSLLPNHLHDLTYWNLDMLGASLKDYDFWDAQPAGNSVQYTGAKVVFPNIIGLHGSPATFVTEHLGIYESPGTPVRQESLYEAQLQHRLGSAPAWIAEVKQSWSAYLASGHF